MIFDSARVTARTPLNTGAALKPESATSVAVTAQEPALIAVKTNPFSVHTSGVVVETLSCFEPVMFNT